MLKLSSCASDTHEAEEQGARARGRGRADCGKRKQGGRGNGKGLRMSVGGSTQPSHARIAAAIAERPAETDGQIRQLRRRRPDSPFTIKGCPPKPEALCRRCAACTPYYPVLPLHAMMRVCGHFSQRRAFATFQSSAPAPGCAAPERRDNLP
jgi:hypothetical protein